MRSVFASLWRLAVLGMGLIAGTPAEASTRKVCFELKAPDVRYDCPSASPMATRKCDGTKPGWPNTYLVGFRYTLWDKDGPDPANDEMIASYIRGGEGKRCAEFEWENSDVDKGEDHPDVFVKVDFLVWDKVGDMKVQAWDSTAVANLTSPVDAQDIVDGAVSFGVVTTRASAVFMNCKNGPSCDLGTIIAGKNRNSARNLAIIDLDTVFRTLQAFSGHIGDSVGSDRVIDFYLFDVPPSNTSNNSAFSTNIGDELFVESSRADDGDSPAHEIGHLIHSREKFNLTTSSGNYTYDSPDNEHTLTSVEYESVAMAEGFADYVAVRSWYDPETWTSNRLWQPNYSGANFEDSAPPVLTAAASEPHRNELQVGRGFWDLDDEHTDGGPGPTNDATDWPTSRVLNEWSSFVNTPAPLEEANRGSLEYEGVIPFIGPDDDGVNMKDYKVNAGFTAAETESCIEVNQLDLQDNL